MFGVLLMCSYCGSFAIYFWLAKNIQAIKKKTFYLFFLTFYNCFVWFTWQLTIEVLKFYCATETLHEDFQAICLLRLLRIHVKISLLMTHCGRAPVIECVVYCYMFTGRLCICVCVCVYVCSEELCKLLLSY